MKISYIMIGLCAVWGGYLGVDAYWLRKPTPKAVSTYKVYKEKRQSFVSLLQTGNCFRSDRMVEPEYRFEKAHRRTGNIYIVLFTDNIGQAFLIAQPEPNCQYSSEESDKCKYWIRTMSFSQPFLLTGHDRIIDCPRTLNREIMLKRVENSSNKYRLNMQVIRSQ